MPDRSTRPSILPELLLIPEPPAMLPDPAWESGCSVLGNGTVLLAPELFELGPSRWRNEALNTPRVLRGFVDVDLPVEAALFHGSAMHRHDQRQAKIAGPP
jgi:hypothetical protein